MNGEVKKLVLMYNHSFGNLTFSDYRKALLMCRGEPYVKGDMLARASVGGMSKNTCSSACECV